MAEKITLARRPENPPPAISPVRAAVKEPDRFATAGVASGVVGSICVGLSLLAGYFLQGRLGLYVGRTSYVATGELLLIAAGLACAHGFVFVLRRGYIGSRARPEGGAMARAWADLTIAYMLELALLFLIKDPDFALGKTALLLGYAVALGLAAAQAHLLMPVLATRGIREGRKRLVIKAGGVTTAGPRAQDRIAGRHEEIPKAVERPEPHVH